MTLDQINFEHVWEALKREDFQGFIYIIGDLTLLPQVMNVINDLFGAQSQISINVGDFGQKIHLRVSFPLEAYQAQTTDIWQQVRMRRSFQWEFEITRTEYHPSLLAR